MTIATLLNMTPLQVTAGGQTYVGMRIADLTAAGAPAAAILAAAQAWLSTSVDKSAESLRTQVLTPGSGQTMEYQETLAEANAAIAANSATAASYPMLAASIGIDIDPTTKAPATDVLGVARAIVAAYTAVTAFGAAIRAARLKGKAAINAAADLPTAVAAYDAIAWPAVPVGAVS